MNLMVVHSQRTLFSLFFKTHLSTTKLISYQRFIEYWMHPQHESTRIMIYVNQWKYAITMTTLLLTTYKHATWIIQQNIYKIISKMKKFLLHFFYKKQKKYWLHETITKNLLNHITHQTSRCPWADIID